MSVNPPYHYQQPQHNNMQNQPPSHHPTRYYPPPPGPHAPPPHSQPPPQYQQQAPPPPPPPQYYQNNYYPGQQQYQNPPTHHHPPLSHYGNPPPYYPNRPENPPQDQPKNKQQEQEKQPEIQQDKPIPRKEITPQKETTENQVENKNQQEEQQKQPPANQQQQQFPPSYNHPQPEQDYNYNTFGYAQQQQPYDADQLAELSLHLEKEIEQLLEFLSDPNANKPLFLILRETCDKMKRTIHFDFQPDPYDSTSHVCYIFISNELFGQGSGRSKKDARTLSSKNACFKLLSTNPDALEQFKIQTQKELQKRETQNIHIQAPSILNKTVVHTGCQEEDFKDYDSKVNYKEELNELAHKNLRTQIRYHQYQEDKLWVSICKVHGIEEKGVAKTTKDAKNLAAYKALQRIKELEEEQPGLFIKAEKQKPKNKKKRQNQLENLPEEYHPEQIALVQKKIHTNPVNQEQQQQINDKEKEKEESALDKLDSRNINFDLFDNKFLDKETKLSKHLNKFLKQITPSDEDIEECENLVQELFQHEQALKQLNISSIIPVGSYANKTLLKQKLKIDIYANYTLPSDTENKEEIMLKLFNENSILLKQLLDGLLKKPETISEPKERVFISTQEQSIVVHSIKNPKITLNIYPNFLNNSNPKYGPGIHNAIWLNRFGNLQDIPNLQNLMRLIRFLRFQNTFNTPIEILDWVLYISTFKFTQCQLVRGIIDFFKQIANNNCFEDVIQKNNASIYEINNLQLNLLQKADQKNHLQQLKQFSKRVYENEDFIDIFIIKENI